MRIETKKSSTPIGALVVAALFLIFVSVMVISSITSADNGKPVENGRILTIHDRGVEKVIVTTAATIGDALKEANIFVDTSDAVEPSIDQKLVAPDYQVNIYRSRPVLVVDGNIRQKIVTPYQTAEQITQSVGIKLYPEDKTVIAAAENLADGASLQLTITRAVPFEFNFYGQTAQARTQAKTVADMLKEKNITISETDRISMPVGSEITAGMSLRIWREGKQTVAVEEAVKFETEKIEDIDQPVNYRLIKSAGVEGLRTVTYEITVQDGVEVSRSEIASITTKQPIKQVEVVGAKGQYTTPSENETITWNFLISQGFNRYQTAGIMGNLMQEHGFQTSGDGLAQWTGGRKAALMSRPNPYNIYTQLDYLMYELNTGYYRVRDSLKASPSLESATIIFQDQFERCGVCRQDTRIQFARNILASH